MGRRPTRAVAAAVDLACMRGREREGVCQG
jgi:hypothetical protein